MQSTAAHICSLASEQFFSKTDFELIPLSSEYHDEAKEIISETFTREPLVSLTKSTKSQLAALAEIVLAQNAMEQVSVLLREKSTKKIVAFLCCEESADAPTAAQAAVFPLQEKFMSSEHNAELGSILALLEELNKRNVSRPAGKRLYHVFMGGTLKEYEGKGLGTKLRESAVFLAKHFGFDGLVIEATNPITAMIWHKKLGFEVPVVINLKDYAEKHDSRFAGAHQTVSLCVKYF